MESATRARGEPAVLDKRSPVPLYYQLRNVIEDRIDSGSWPPDTLVPSERELCEQFGIDGQRFLRALNIETGDIVWEVPQPGPARAKTWTGLLATAGGLLFYGQPNGGFTAADQRTGKTLWRFPTNVRMKASPMTFALGGKQYIVVAAGPNILCFGL